MNAIRFPEGCHDGCETSKSPLRQLARPGAGAGRDEEQVLAPVARAAVVLPVGRPDDAGDVLLRVAGPEPHLVALRDERDRAPVGRPERSAHGAVGRCADALGLAAVGVDQEELGFGLVVWLAGVGPVRDEGDRAPVGRPCRRRVAPFPVGEPPWPPAGGRNQPEVHLVAVAGHGPPRVRRRAARPARSPRRR